MDSIITDEKRSRVYGLFKCCGVIQRDRSYCRCRVLMPFAGCWYRSALGKGQGLKDTALDVGQSEMGGEAVAFWKNGDRCRCGQDWVNMDEKDRKNHKEIT